MADALHPDAWRATVRRRLVVVAVIFATWSAAVQARLVWLQVHEHDHFVQKAERQQSRTLTLPAMRGTITDREGRMLATSADADTVFAVPTEIDDPSTTARKLCQVLVGCPSSKDQNAQLVERLSKRRAFTYVKRHVSPEEAAAVVALKLDGVGLRKESRRFYPMRELMAGVLGYVGFDNKGLAGIEQQYNDIIRGKDGQALVYTDAKRHAFDSVNVPPTAGSSIELTIDAALQHVVERELARGVAEHRAASGVAIVMDPWTGEVLAMASVPTFNPNTFSEANEDDRRNLGVTYIYEPGSTFKTFTASAVLQERLLTPESPIDCAPGYITIGSRRVNDTHRYGVLSFTDVIIKSSNVGAIKAGFRVGTEQMQRYVRRFGFGTRLSPDLPGEQAGIVWNELNASALASVSMGYQIGVTPLQMATAVSSIANGGQLMRPRLVRAFWNGGTRRAVAPEVIRRTVTPETAATLTTIMEGVVDRGTAKTARIEGYTIAAKTGTAAKLDNGAYSKQKYNSSIVGFFPSRKPAITVIVVIDTPRVGGYYGGVVAGPVFKHIVEAAIQHIGLPRTINPEQPVMVARHAAQPVTPVAYGPGAVLPAGAASSRDGVMPDLRGLSARTAVRTLARAGFTPRLAGQGVVTAQDPMAGTPLDPGTSVRLWLDREASTPSVDPATQP
ncbi:MAG: transpeptidase family protein [Vicinamibacteria bacterium]|nr:transpeptidase family protein [Vicinamibacteria bacterium]